ncbi:MAG: DHHW family protein [Oscillospiraceae bacterium]
MKNSIKSILALALTASLLSGCNIVVDGGESSDTTSGSTSQTDTSKDSSASGDSSTKSDSPSTESKTESTSSEPAPVDPDLDAYEGEMSDKVFVMSNGRGIVRFYGTNEGAERYAGILNQYKEKLGDAVNVYTLVAPTSGTYYMPDKYKKDLGISDEKAVIAHIGESLKDVKNIDVCETLGKHKNEHIYSSTDHHWQQLGAYYAAEDFAKAAGVPFTDLSKFEKVVMEGYVGTLYGYSSENPKIRDNPEEFVYYIPPVQTTVTQYPVNDLTAGKTVPLLTNIQGWKPVSWYLVFGTDDVVRHIQTETKNGRKLLVVKDSYGNALIPNLVGSFEEIWVTDMRYFNGSITEFAKEKGITDLLFTMNSFSAVGGNQNKLPTIM